MTNLAGDSWVDSWVSRILKTCQMPESSTLAAGLPATFFFVIMTPSRLFTVFTQCVPDSLKLSELDWMDSV